MTDQPRVCLSCGKPADVEIETILHPLTALGERMYERLAKQERQPAPACVNCLRNMGQATIDGHFAEEEP
jgi:hypothetical protein